MPTLRPHDHASDVSSDAVAEVCASRSSFASFLVRLSLSSTPATGYPWLFASLVHLASGACEWIDGDLAIELVEEDDGTVVQIMTELGGGMRERAFAPCKLRVPLAEVAAAIDAAPALASALKVKKSSWRRIALLATEDARRSTRPPRISDTSLVAQRHVPIAKKDAPPSGLRPAVTPLPRAPSPSSDEAALEEISASWDD